MRCRASFSCSVAGRLSPVFGPGGSPATERAPGYFPLSPPSFRRSRPR